MKGAGFTEKQAETQAEALAEIFGANLATKLDIELLRKEIAQTKGEIIKWVAGMLVAQAAIVATLVKLL